MRTNTYDPDADAAYVPLGEADIYESEEIAPGVIADFDKQGRIVGFELLTVSKILAPGRWQDWPMPGSDAHAHAAE